MSWNPVLWNPLLRVSNFAMVWLGCFPEREGCSGRLPGRRPGRRGEGKGRMKDIRKREKIP